MMEVKHNHKSKLFAALFIIPIIAGCSLQKQGCESDEAAVTIASEYEDPEGLVSAEFEDVLELASDDRFAVCSGKLMVTDVAGNRRSVQPLGAALIEETIPSLSVEMEFTWRVQETESGESYFQWVVGRKSASAFE